MTRHTVHPLWGSLSIERDGGTSLQEQVVSYFRKAVLEQRLPRGQRLPSSRQLAIDHGISRTTAVEAYERLVAEGYLVARPGSGLYVAEQFHEDLVPDGAPCPPEACPAPGRDDAGPRDLRTYQLPLAPGMPATDLFPWLEWRRHVAAVLREDPLNEIAHGDPRGERPLREEVASYLGAMKGIACDPDQVLVMAGTFQLYETALQLVSGSDVTLRLEDPLYPFIPPMAERLGFAIESCAVDAGGLDAGAAAAVQRPGTVTLVSPSHQMPTGTRLSLERREALVAQAEAGGGWIIENEFDADFRFSTRALPTCHALSKGGRVILLGAVTKPFAPGLRIGYLVVPPDLLPRALAIDLPQTPVTTQLALARFSRSGELASHLRQLRVVHAHRRRLLIEALQAEAADLLSFSDAPEAGLRLLTLLPSGSDDRVIVAAALAQGLRIEALSPCFRHLPPRPGLLLGFASTPEDRIAEAVSRLAGIIRASPARH